jgi:hypothetical protein
MKTASLSYPESLRAIGESLELQGISFFEIAPSKIAGADENAMGR